MHRRRRGSDKSAGPAAEGGLDLSSNAVRDLLQELVPDAESTIAAHWEDWERDREVFRSEITHAIDSAVPALSGGVIESLVKRYDRITNALLFISLLGAGILITWLVGSGPFMPFLVLGFVGWAITAVLWAIMLRRKPPLKQAVVSWTLAPLALSVIVAVKLTNLSGEYVPVLYGALFGVVCFAVFAEEATEQVLLPRLLYRARLRKSDTLSLLEVTLLMVAASLPGSEAEIEPESHGAEAIRPVRTASGEATTAKDDPDEETTEFLKQLDPEEVIDDLLSSAATLATRIAPHTLTSDRLSSAHRNRGKRVAGYIEAAADDLWSDDPEKEEAALAAIARAAAAVCLGRWEQFKDATPQPGSRSISRRFAIPLGLILLALLLPFIPASFAQTVSMQLPLVVGALVHLGLVNDRGEAALKGLADSLKARGDT